MRIEKTATLLAMLCLAGCYANNTPRNDAVQDPAESVAQPAEPEATTQQDPLAAEYDARFESESRDPSWATAIETFVDQGMMEGKSTAVSEMVCKSTVCRGVYRFDSLQDKRRAWSGIVSNIKSDTPLATLRVPISKLEDTYYVVKIAPNAERID